MTQKIEQQIDIKVTESGIDATVAKLKQLDTLSSSLKSTTVKVAGSVNNASKQAVKSVNAVTSATAKANKTVNASSKQTAQHAKSMTALSASQIPLVESLRNSSNAFQVFNTKENNAIDSVLRKIQANKTLSREELDLARSLNTLTKQVNREQTAEQKATRTSLAYAKAAKSVAALKNVQAATVGVDLTDYSRSNTAKYSTSGQMATGNISSSEYANLTKQTQAYTASAKKATSASSKLADKLKSVGSQAKKSTTNIFRLRAAFALALGVVYVFSSAISEWFSLSSDYAESMHLLYSTLASSMQDVADSEKTVTLYGKDVFGNMTNESIQVTEGVNDIINSLDDMADKMMLDPTQLNRTFSSFYEMANAAGMAQEKIGKLSLGMSQLTYDLASLWDVPFEEAAASLKSALSGITSSVKSYGIDVSRTAADEWLLTNGFDATYNSLNRANKMIVIYNMLVESTTTAQGDLARSALQPANMLRILGQQAKLAARQLGAAIFPVFTKLIPVAIMLAQAIQRVAAALSSFLGGVLGSWYTDASDQWNSYMKNLGQTSSGVEDVVDELEETEDAADSAGSALEEMTDFTLPFDELHQMNEEMDSSGSGSGSGDGLDLDIPVADMEAWSESLKDIILSDAQETLDGIAAAIDNTFGEGTFDALSNAWDRCALSIKLSIKTLISAFDTLAQAFIGLFDWPALIEGFAAGFHDALETAAAVVYNLADAFSAILENEKVVAFFEDASYSIGEFVGKIAGIALVVAGASAAIGILGAVLTPIKALLGPLIGLISGVISGVVGWIGEVISVVIACEGPMGMLSAAATSVMEGFNGIRTVLSVVAGPIGWVILLISTLVASFIECYTNSQEFRDKVTEAFEKVGEVIGGVLLALQPAFALLQDAFARLKEGLLALQPVWEILLKILPIIVGIIGGLIVAVVTLAAAIFDFIAWVLDTVGQAFGAIADFFLNFGDNISQLWESIKTGASNWVNSIKEVFDDLKKGISDTFNGAKETVLSIADGIKNGILDRFNGIKDRVSSIFNNIKNAITSPIESAKNTLSNIIDRIKSIFNVNISFPHFTLPHITWQTKTLPFFNITLPVGFNVEWYAKGGVFDGPTIAGLGEAGPEAVVPLSGARMRPFAEAVASELQSTGGGSVTGGTNNDALIAAMSTAVYNAMIKGFPDTIKTDVYLDATKVNNSLDNNKRQRGFGSSLVKAGA